MLITAYGASLVITEVKKYDDAQAGIQAARTDKLTGLATDIISIVLEEEDHTQIMRENLNIMMFDIDNFKSLTIHMVIYGEMLLSLFVFVEYKKDGHTCPIWWRRVYSTYR